MGSRRTIAVALIIAGGLCSPGLRAQAISDTEAARVAPYYRYWELADASPSAQHEGRDRLDTAVREAEREFVGRGPDLARYFLNHIQASPGNTAFFFLFFAIGDAATARPLVAALTDPPIPQHAVLGRDPAEIAIAIEAVLKNPRVSGDPAIVALLKESFIRSRQQPGGGRVVTIIIALLGKCATPEAAAYLQTLASDPEPSTRAAAVGALGRGTPAAARTLEGALLDDPNPQVRASAAASLAEGRSSGAATALLAALARETDPRVVDAAVRALITRGELPTDPRTCLAIANRCWDAPVAKPLFDCWRAAASHDEVVGQALSGGWTVRALALDSLAIRREPARRLVVAPITVPSPPPSRPSASPAIVQPIPRAAQAAPAAALDAELRDRLLRSTVDILSQPSSGVPAVNTLSFSSAQLARDAFWEISGRNMSLALSFADRIVPISGRYAYVGRFGELSDLAARDRAAYIRWRRPRQSMAAGVAALAAAALMAVRKLRRMSVALMVSLLAWAVWSWFQVDVRELPPFPLSFLTVSCLAFLAAGIASGSLTALPWRTWLKLTTSPIAAGLIAFAACGVTRSAGIFPIGSDGWELVFEPLTSGLLAMPAALLLSLALEIRR